MMLMVWYYFYQKRKLVKNLNDLVKAIIQLMNRESQHETIEISPWEEHAESLWGHLDQGQGLVFAKCGLFERGAEKNVSSWRQGSGLLCPWTSELVIDQEISLSLIVTSDNCLILPVPVNFLSYHHLTAFNSSSARSQLVVAFKAPL